MANAAQPRTTFTPSIKVAKPEGQRLNGKRMFHHLTPLRGASASQACSPSSAPAQRAARVASLGTCPCCRLAELDWWHWSWQRDKEAHAAAHHLSTLQGFKLL